MSRLDVCVGFGAILYAKIIDYETESGSSLWMVEQAIYMLVLDVAVVLQMCNKALL
jgi:hypothetical protein